MKKTKRDGKDALTTKERVLFWGGLVVLALFLLYTLKTVLIPFAVGLIIAYLLDPVVRRLSRLKIKRTAAAFILIFLIVLFFFVGITFLLPIVHNQTMSFIRKAPTYMDESWAKIHDILLNLKDKMTPEQFEALKQNVSAQFNTSLSFASNILKAVTTQGIAVFSSIALFFITPVIAFYMLKDWPSMKKNIHAYLPKKYKKTVMDLLEEMDRTLSGFLRGQFLVCTLLAFYYSIGLSVIGLDVAIPLGILTGYLIFLPYVGWGIGFALSLVLGYLQIQSGLGLLPVIGLYVAGLFLEGSILTPNLVGKSVRLHPVWVIFSIFVGGYLMGFLGVLLAVPLAGIFAVLLRFALERYRQSKLYEE